MWPVAYPGGVILGIDTSLGTAVAVVEPDGVVRADVHSADPRGHAEVIGDLLVRALDDASVTAHDVTHVAAGMGPGPFTGLRVGIAAARTFALGSGARFIARAYDVAKQLPDVLKAAHGHKGAAFVEIFQNCIVYNKDVFADFTEKKNADEGQLWVEHGKPMLFARGAKGIALDREALALKVVDVVDGDWQGADVIVHDVANRSVAHMLVEMPLGPFPMALGVIYDDPAVSFEQAVMAQNEHGARGKTPDLQKLVSQGQTWTVKGDEAAGPDL